MQAFQTSWHSHNWGSLRTLEEISSNNQQIPLAPQGCNAANDLGGNDIQRKVQVSTKPFGGNSATPGAVATPTSKCQAARFSDLIAIRIFLLHRACQDEVSRDLLKICLQLTPSFYSDDCLDVMWYLASIPGSFTQGGMNSYSKHHKGQTQAHLQDRVSP